MPSARFATADTLDFARADSLRAAGCLDTGLCDSAARLEPERLRTVVAAVSLRARVPRRALPARQGRRAGARGHGG